MPAVRSIDEQPYLPEMTRHEEDIIILQALTIMSRRLKRGEHMGSPQQVKEALRLRCGGLEHEVFGVMFLDAQHGVLEIEEMFRGTLTQTSVYPREVAKRALALNACAVVLYHNHPSGTTEPSRADEHMTATLKSSLALVDVRVLDHVVVSALGATSFAERGLL